MSLIPHLINELVRPSYDPLNRLYDQNFGFGLVDDDLLYPRPSVLDITTPLLAGYIRPHRHQKLENSGISSIVSDKDNFQVSLDVQQFKPEEINVKVVDDFVVVDGKHEERQDKHGFVSRQFTRRYRLPPNVEVEGIKSSLSSDGILSITAPKKQITESGSRQIPVVQTNQPAIKQTKQGGRGDSGEKMET